MLQLRRLASRNLFTVLLIAVIAFLACVNMLQARVIQMQREEVRNSMANDFIFMRLFATERARSAGQNGASQNKKPGPTAPANSPSH